MKITVVGSGFVGKTCIVYTYVTGRYVENLGPTVFEDYAKDIKVDGRNYSVRLCDSPGPSDFDGLRPIFYSNTSCFLLCFSVDSRGSYEHVYNRWVKELRRYKKNTPIVLVGTKIDLRNNKNIVTIPFKEGKNLAEVCKVDCYMECSAKENRGLKEVFEAAVRAALNPNNNKKDVGCDIL